jgi:hypothetical protein
MAKVNARQDAARKAYREALDAARASPTAEAWTKLLAAGKELSAAEEPRPRSRRGRKPAERPEAVIEPTEIEVVEPTELEPSELEVADGRSEAGLE